MDTKESGNRTIRAEDNNMNFDQSEWRRISTAMKNEGDETSSCQQRVSVAGEEKTIG